MAKIKYSFDIQKGLGDFGDATHLEKLTGKKAVWIDGDTDARMKLEGKGFQASNVNDDYLSAGKIDKLTVVDGKGHLVVTVDDLNVKATQVFKAFDNGGFEGVVNFMTKGDDVQVGSKKADTIFGGGGNDILTGKGGSDTFFFSSQNPNAKPEHDIITDFKTTGPNADMLMIYDSYDIQSRHGGRDTLLDFDDGSTLLLKHVTNAEFETYIQSIY